MAGFHGARMTSISSSGSPHRRVPPAGISRCHGPCPSCDGSGTAPNSRSLRTRVTCRFTTGGIRVLPDRKHVQLPRIGVVKTHESTRKLARRLEQGTARLLAATISRTANRWFVSFTVEVQRQVPASNARTSVVGVDVGVRYLAVLSTGQIIPNPRALEGSLHRLRRLNRALARRTPGSKRRNQPQQRLARVSARAISATGTAQLRRQLAYKATWYGCRLVVADRFFPSSKTCSGCGG
jgi:putative transposase